MTKYNKDIFRTIKKEFKRFLALVVISTLSLMMLSGLQASCQDLRISAQEFFNNQKLHDFYIQSTLGLTDNDIKVLKNMKDITTVSPMYEETVHIQINKQSKSVNMKTYRDNMLDMPYLLEGNYPKEDKDILVPQHYLHDSNKVIGDSIVIKEDDDNFKRDTFTITGIIVDPTDINAVEGASSFRSTATTDYTFYVLPNVIDSDIYTGIALTMIDNNNSILDTEGYESHRSEVLENIVSIKDKQEKQRTQSLKNKAYDKLNKQRTKANNKFIKAENKFSKAKKKLEDGKKKLDKSLKELKKQEKKAKKEFKKGKKQLKTYLKKINSGLKKINKTKAELPKNKTILINELEKMKAAEVNVPYMTDMGRMAFYNGKKQLERELKKLQIAEKRLPKQEKQLLKQKKKILKNQKKLLKQEKQTNKQIKDGYKKINQGYKDYQTGINKYHQQYQKYLKEKKKALKKLDEAEKDIEDIDDAKWYIQTRNHLSGYTNVLSDAGAIESLAVVFSIIFMIVALLMSLTTVNRLVEEERGLIGTYQALGLTDREIRKKYLMYALLSSLIGCILGNICGFIGFPMIIFTIFSAMYQIPQHMYSYHYMISYGIGGSLLIMISIGIAVIYTCRHSLKQYPATLMRPKSPKAGSRVLLERITPIWKHLSFLNKVTARNLFRYKKRLLMTIIGIAGCTSLLICGFAIKDSVDSFIVKQYGDIAQYDWLGVVSKDNDQLSQKLSTYKDIDKRTELLVESVTVEYKNKTEVIQLYVFPDKTNIEDYIHLNDFNTRERLVLNENDLFVTKNIAFILDFDQGDSINICNLQFDDYDFKVSAVLENYLGNGLYMRESTYNKTFKDYKSNAQMVLTKNNDILDVMSQDDRLLSSIKTQSLRDDFSTSVALINMVVYLIIAMAAALAFVVLFILSTTNISERERELATIKVLGFFDNEVHLYVNKETIILTSIGMILGIPLGLAIAHSLTPALKMSSIYFEITLQPIGYLLSILLTLLFGMIVMIITNSTLNKIDPIEALKSIE